MSHAKSREELLAIGRDLIAVVGQDERPLQVAAGRVVNMAHAPMVFALSRHSIRVGAIALDLHEQEKSLEAMPLVRAVYEYALTAQWLTQSREAPAAFFNEDVRQRSALAGDMARAPLAWFREGAANIAHADAEALESSANSQARHFKRLCEALQPGGFESYVYYRIMSSYVHPSSTLIDQYVQAHEGPSGVLLKREPHSFDHEAWLFLTVTSMMWAARALDLMHRDRPHRSYLRRVARELGVPETLDLTPEARAAESRAEQERRRSSWKGRKRRRPNVAG